jgi:predicted regulator of Ras-like GTPase activity (Roadblock/LC7/MglB family)
MLFADIIGDTEQTALLLDAEGYVLAGAYLAPDGREVAQEVGAELSGVSEEAQRAMRHLDLGDWSSIVFETDVAVVSMAPSSGQGLVLLASARSLPLGLVRRYLERAAARAKLFLERVA